MKILFPIVSLLFVVLVGCGPVVNYDNSKPFVVPDPNTSVENYKKDIQAGKVELEQTIIGVEKNIVEINNQIPIEIKERLQKYFTDITAYIARQKVLVKELEKISTKIELSQKEIDKVKNALTKQIELTKIETKRANDAESSRTQALRDKYTTVSILCFVALLLSGALFFSGYGVGTFVSKLAMGIAIMSGAGLALALFIVQISPILPYIVGGVVLVMVGLFVWRFIEDHRAIKETVATVEKTKESMTPVEKVQVFGTKSKIGDVANIQSASTKKMVAKIKKKVKKPTLPA